MKISQSLSKPLKDAPKDADTRNHALLVQAGYVRQLMAGVYTYLPLGLRVLQNIGQIVREEMNGIGGQEILMPALIPSANLKQSGSWDNVDILFKLHSQTEREYGLGFSHEEVVTPLVQEFVPSYKNLPLAVYQIQWKFRDELRAKSGILRGREFQMKDMYSFHETQEDFARFYELAKQAYLRVFDRIGLTAKVTEASGGNFSKKISYEFMVLTDAGEDDILYCDTCEFCVNTEIAKQKVGDSCPKCNKGTLAMARASEVGNIFDLGLKYSTDFNFTFTTATGEKAQPIMGCYGIGISRTMGVITEKMNDERGIIWPKTVAPFAAQLVSLPGGEEKAAKLYEALLKSGVAVLWDDREIQAGAKFAHADLMGMPVRLVVSGKTGEQVEWKLRTSPDTELVDESEVIRRLEQ